MNFPHTVLNVLYSGNAVLCVIASPAIQHPLFPCPAARWWDHGTTNT
jgi:hypothetical protein